VIRLVGRFPMSLAFDHDPGDRDLATVVGPAFTVGRVPWSEDDERIVVNQPVRLPVKTIAVILVLVFGGVSVLPWVLPWLSLARAPVDSWFALVVAAVVWLLVIPGVTWLLHAANAARQQLGPGAVVTKRTGELELPWIARIVQRRDLVRFVDLRGRHRHRSGAVSFYCQYGVLFVVDGSFVYASIARATATPFGKTCAQRLADFYDLPVQRVDAGAI
jgi:hypothetical protein